MSSSLLDRAIAIAHRAHQGQVDKAGKPYVDHPLRVMARLETEEEKIVGVLHDAVEDSDLTLDDLRREGFGENTLSAIDSVTKRAGEEYEAYLARVMANRVGLKAKIEDMKDNLDLGRIAQPTQKDHQRIAGYQKTLPRLQAALWELEHRRTRPGR